MERLEKDIEKEFGRKLSSWASEQGYNVAFVKFTGAKSWPDRIITWGVPDGTPQLMWVEFKRPGERPRPMQVHIHKILRAMGHEVFVWDSVRENLDYVKERIKNYYTDLDKA